MIPINSITTFQTSEHLTAPPTALIAAQGLIQKVGMKEMYSIKENIIETNWQRQVNHAKEVNDQLSSQMQSCCDLAQEKWPSSCPIRETLFLNSQGKILTCIILKMKVEPKQRSSNLQLLVTVLNNHATVRHVDDHTPKRDP